MKQIVLKIVFLAVIAQSCKAAIIVQTARQETIIHRYEALIDVLMECYADGSKTVGVVGDSDGIVLNTLWRKHSISTVLVDSTVIIDNFAPTKNLHELQVFVIVATVQQFFPMVQKLRGTVWWNQYARFLIMSPTPDKVTPLSQIANILIRAYLLGLLNAQFIDFDSDMNVVVTDFNPYTAKAPQQWKLFATIRVDPPVNLFKQLYRKGQQTCEALSFEKTTDLGGYPFEITSTSMWVFCQLTKTCNESDQHNDKTKEIDETLIQRYRWFVDNIRMALNVSVILTNLKTFNGNNFDISIVPSFASEFNLRINSNRAIYTFDQVPMFVITQHTAHMTQLEKILSVIDKDSQIGMYIVYLITFGFFKFFLRQAVIPSILNLVRLTCNTGLPRVPNNLAPTIYLACLFMFVINLQAIYTGNLASLLTTTIAYPHVNRKADIVKLGYQETR